MEKILQLHYNQIDQLISRNTLDGITSSVNTLGKKHNNYWIIKNTNQIATDANVETEMYNLNNILGLSLRLGYTNVMIIDR